MEVKGEDEGGCKGCRIEDGGEGSGGAGAGKVEVRVEECVKMEVDDDQQQQVPAIVRGCSLRLCRINGKTRNSIRGSTRTRPQQKQ
jgi:hypothetical protein